MTTNQCRRCEVEFSGVAYACEQCSDNLMCDQCSIDHDGLCDSCEMLNSEGDCDAPK